PPEIKALIKKADRACAHFEAVELAGFTPAEAISFFGSPPKEYVHAVEPMSTTIAEDRYLHRFAVLSQAAGFTPLTDAAFDTE
ncbi:MAG TPA: HD family hydrolase, partial [Caulobacteraceae bacterium]|nr:HD family hydrolase [Caulobacteraceae bacterium]